jgi:hypothetical protein
MIGENLDILRCHNTALGGQALFDCACGAAPPQLGRNNEIIQQSWREIDVVSKDNVLVGVLDKLCVSDPHGFNPETRKALILGLRKRSIGNQAIARLLTEGFDFAFALDYIGPHIVLPLTASRNFPLVLILLVLAFALSLRHPCTFQALNP